MIDEGKMLLDAYDNGYKDGYRNGFKDGQFVAYIVGVEAAAWHDSEVILPREELNVLIWYDGKYDVAYYSPCVINRIEANWLLSDGMRLAESAYDELYWMQLPEAPSDDEEEDI